MFNLEQLICFSLRLNKSQTRDFLKLSNAGEVLCGKFNNYFLIRHAQEEGRCSSVMELLS